MTLALLRIQSKYFELEAQIASARDLVVTISGCAQLGAHFALIEATSLLKRSVEQQLREASDLSYVQFQLLARSPPMTSRASPSPSPTRGARPHASDTAAVSTTTGTQEDASDALLVAGSLA